MKRRRRFVVMHTDRIEQIGNGAVEVELTDTHGRQMVLYFPSRASRRGLRQMIYLTEKVWGIG